MFETFIYTVNNAMFIFSYNIITAIYLFGKNNNIIPMYLFDGIGITI